MVKEHCKECKGHDEQVHFVESLAKLGAKEKVLLNKHVSKQQVFGLLIGLLFGISIGLLIATML